MHFLAVYIRQFWVVVCFILSRYHLCDVSFKKINHLQSRADFSDPLLQLQTLSRLCNHLFITDYKLKMTLWGLPLPNSPPTWSNVKINRISFDVWFDGIILYLKKSWWVFLTFSSYGKNRWENNLLSIYLKSMTWIVSHVIKTNNFCSWVCY